ncbi:MAG: lipase family protein [Balneolaceae bacterium]
MNRKYARRVLLYLGTFLLAWLTAGCDIFRSDDGEEAEHWDTLSSYQEIGTLSSDQIADIYPTGMELLLTYDIKLYRVVYSTEDPGGNPVLASGVLLLPQEKELSAMLSLHRTTVLHRDEVPSNVSLSDIPSGLDAGEGPVNTVWANFAPVMASAGFITVMPDLLGWGESSNFSPPYLVSFSEAVVSLDMLRAAVELTESLEAEWTGDLFVAGYSQGGSTTLSLLRGIQADPRQQFEVTAASAGGGAYNLEELASAILQQEELGFAPYYVLFLQAYADVYFPERPMNTFFSSPYDLIIESEDLFGGEFTGDEIADRLTGRTGDLFLNRFRNNYITSNIQAGPESELRSAFRENDLSRFRVNSPLRIYHGDLDRILPFAEAEQSVQNLRDAGTEDVELVRIPHGTHRSAAIPFFLETFLWFTESE